jgi:hypothetical protein
MCQEENNGCVWIYITTAVHMHIDAYCFFTVRTAAQKQMF